MAASRKVTLTITISKDNYESLKLLVPSGKVSELINELIESKIEILKEEIADEYRRESQDKITDEEAASWYIIHRGGKNEKN
jgi:predicted CopG family antitoxin